jgi:hypothetical protein
VCSDEDTAQAATAPLAMFLVPAPLPQFDDANGGESADDCPRSYLCSAGRTLRLVIHSLQI